MPDFILQLKGAAFGPGGREILAGLDWTLEPGQRWALLGPAGSGKTSLARALCGEIPLSGGQRRLPDSAGPDPALYVGFGTGGEQALRRSPYLQARWYGWEEEGAPSLADFLRGEKANPFVLSASPLPATDLETGPARALVERLGLAPLLSRRMMQLSNGELRRALMARALMKRPPLLVLDDPFTGLDKASRREVGLALEELMARGQDLVLAAARAGDLPGGLTHFLRLQAGSPPLQGPISSLPTAPPAGAGAPEAFDLPGDLLRPAGPPPPGPYVELNHVHVGYGETRILKDLSWKVERGQRWLLAGPNGSGKSTLLSLLLADHPQAYANDLVLFGKKRGSGESIWDIKKNLGWVGPELQAFLPGRAPLWKVVASGFFDSLDLFRPCAPHQEARARGWLAALGLAPLAGASFHGLSQAQQRLGLLARALVKGPALLLLDEPAQGLDAGGRRLLLSVLKALARDPDFTLVYVTHHDDEIPDCLTHSLRLEAGRAVSLGPLP